MVGTLSIKGANTALIADKDGTIHPIKIGDYIGKDYGKVTKVQQNQINIMEKIHTGGAWIARSRVITMTSTDEPEKNE